jgi:hypothetical protein
MMTLSQLNTMVPLGRILDEELVQGLNRRFGRPAFPIKVETFGYGARFALTGKQGGLGRGDRRQRGRSAGV